MLKRRMIRGFTIVELLVVIVVIGILAAISMVSYIGINERAIGARITSDLNNDAKLLELYKVENDVYPSSLDGNNCPATPTANTKYCLVVSGPEDTLTYVGGGNDYTLTITDHRSGKAYEIVPGGTVVAVDGGSEPPIIDYMKAVGGVDSEFQSQMIKTSDGGYASVGNTDSFGAGGQDVYVTKFDSNLNLTWMKTWGSNGSDEYGGSIVQTNDGGYAVTGSSYNYASEEGHVFIAKFDSTGAMLWDKTWGEAGTYGSSIVHTTDGGYAVTGTVYSETTGGDMFIAKFDSMGAILWEKTWGGADSDEGSLVIQTSDGGYAVTGRTISFSAGMTDMFIVKYDSEGNLSWDKTWGGVDEDYVGSIIQTTDGGYVVVGGTFDTEAADSFIIKYDSAGNISWNNIWSGVDSSWGHSVMQTADGGYSVGGETYDYDTENTDAFVMKYDSAGNVSWAKTWGGAGDEFGYSIVQSNDSGYILTGDTISYGAGDTDMFIIQYDLNGAIAGCHNRLCKDANSSTSSPTATVSSPAADISILYSVSSDVNASVIAAAATVTSISYIYTSPNADIVFHSGELRVGYPGEDKTVCKEWSLPSFDSFTRYIAGFYVNQDTELNYDFFTVSIDGTEVYRQSGDYENTPVDVSSMHGETVRVCMQTDSQNNSGFGGEVTGIDLGSDAF